MIVLDTNVVSELLKAAPDARVVAWTKAQPWDQLVISAVTEAELLAGVAFLPEGQRRTALQGAIAAIINQALGGRVLPLDRAAAPHFAAFRAARRAAGRAIDTADAMIGAIARAHGASLLATRNTADFEGCGVQLINPFLARP
jgi:toxin FitB